MAERIFLLTDKELDLVKSSNIEDKITGLTGKTFDEAWRYMNDYGGFQMTTDQQQDGHIIVGYRVHTSDTPHPEPVEGIPQDILEFLHNPPPADDEHFIILLSLNKKAYQKMYRSMFTSRL
ncbi:MAG: hypothetical protein ABIO57_02600 [Candidatus Paceibacterota bacterium]